MKLAEARLKTNLFRPEDDATPDENPKSILESLVAAMDRVEILTVQI